MSETEKRLLHALFRALDGEKKAAAAAIYPNLDPDVGAKRLDRVASGELAIPAGLVVHVLRGETAQQWLDAQAAIARRDPEADRQRAVSELRELGRQVADALARLEDADAAELRAERRGPVRARPRERRGVA